MPDVLQQIIEACVDGVVTHNWYGRCESCGHVGDDPDVECCDEPDWYGRCEDCGEVHHG
jgi:hypothetical protein